MLVLSRNKGKKGGGAAQKNRKNAAADNGDVEPLHVGGDLGPTSPIMAWEQPHEKPPKNKETLLSFEDALAKATATGSGWEVFKVHYSYRVAVKFDKVAQTSRFQNFITGIIMVAALLVGIQTYKSMENNSTLALLDNIVLYIFTAEVMIKLIAAGTKPWEYFNDSWNRFDFLVVFVCYLPLDASMVTVLRLFRLLRVLKLVKALPELQVLVKGLLSSLSSIVYVALLLMLVFYLYGVLCVSLFRDNDPVHFGTLETTFLTLFRMATFEDWTDVMYTQMFGCEVYPYHFREHWCTNPSPQGWYPAPFFISFVVLSSFVVLNLFIGVITSNMQEARDEQKKGDEEEEDDEDKGRNLADAIENAKVMMDAVESCYSEMQEVMNTYKKELQKIQKAQGKDKDAGGGKGGGGGGGGAGGRMGGGVLRNGDHHGDTQPLTPGSIRGSSVAPDVNFRESV